MNEEERKLRRKRIKKRIIKKKNQPPELPVIEEIGNSISHGLGFIFGVLALILMLIHQAHLFMMQLI